jgi:hypothetical protein
MISSYLSRFLNSFLGLIGAEQAEYAVITAEMKVINKITGEINMTSITKNCKEEITLSCKNKDSQAVITNLSLATEIIFQFKESLSGSAVIELKLSDSEIEIDTPATGDIKLIILPAKTTSVTAGNKIVGCEVRYSSTDIREIELTEKNRVVETIEVKEERVT